MITLGKDKELLYIYFIYTLYILYLFFSCQDFELPDLLGTGMDDDPVVVTDSSSDDALPDTAIFNSPISNQEQGADIPVLNSQNSQEVLPGIPALNSPHINPVTVSSDP